MDAIRESGVRIGADPLGGASVAYWGEIGDRYGLDLTVVNPHVDPTWRFMTLDWDGKIRMDCSSPYAMASLIAQKDRVPDRHRQRRGRRPARHRHPGRRPDEPEPLPVGGDLVPVPRTEWLAGGPAIGKTLVSSSMIDRVAADLGRRLVEVPVGFKWFVPGLLDGSIGFGGEESAGASFLRRDGCAWTTDKDGILLDLLASEILAITGRTPSEHYRDLTARFGDPAYARIDAPATREEKAILAKLSPGAGDRDRTGRRADHRGAHQAPGNGAPIGGLKVATEPAGSPPGRPAPRTSTRSTPSRSTARTTWPGSRRRPARWSAPPSAPSDAARSRAEARRGAPRSSAAHPSSRVTAPRRE